MLPATQRSPDCRLGPTHLLVDFAGAAAGRALDSADLSCPLALAAHILGHSRRARITFIARVGPGGSKLEDAGFAGGGFSSSGPGISHGAATRGGARGRS